MMHTQLYFFLILGAITSCHCEVPLQDDPGEGPLILTPYVESGETEKAKSLSAVDPSHFAGVDSYAGYFTVNQTSKWHLFFWYFPALMQVLPLDGTPVVIWLQGGSVSSSLFGLFNEIGPLQIKNGKAEIMNTTWARNYSLLFIDNPVGAGFSYTENDDLYATDENMVGECLLSFIQQFLQVFPELRKAPLFIAGESYAGKFIPAFGHYIHNNKNDSMPINLKGLAIGNGWIDPMSLLYYAEFGYQIGLIDEEASNAIKSEEMLARHCLRYQQWECAYMLASDVFETLKYESNITNAHNYLDDSHYSTDFIHFLNKPEVQDAIHAKRMEYVEWSDDVQHNLRDDIYDTVKPWLEELLEHYGVMLYSGQLDVKVPYSLSVNLHRNLQWSGQKAYLVADREPIYDDTQTRKVNSFLKVSGNFMEVMVRNAGQMVPTDQPDSAKQMIDIFIGRFK